MAVFQVVEELGSQVEEIPGGGCGEGDLGRTAHQLRGEEGEEGEGPGLPLTGLVGVEEWLEGGPQGGPAQPLSEQGFDMAMNGIQERAKRLGKGDAVHGRQEQAGSSAVRIQPRETSAEVRMRASSW